MPKAIYLPMLKFKKTEKQFYSLLLVKSKKDFNVSFSLVLVSTHNFNLVQIFEPY